MKTFQTMLLKTQSQPQPQTQVKAPRYTESKKNSTNKNMTIKTQSNPIANKKKPYRKQKISAALREQVWVQHNGLVFQHKCKVTWCQNDITVFNFQCGHDIPESKGGPTNITNLYPICGKCNLSMSNTYTFTEWCKMYEAKPPSTEIIQSTDIPKQTKQSFWKRLCSCFR